MWMIRAGTTSPTRGAAGRAFPNLVLQRGAHRIDKVALQRIERERPGIEVEPVDRPVLVARRNARERIVERRRQPVAAQRGVNRVVRAVRDANAAIAACFIELSQRSREGRKS